MFCGIIMDTIRDDILRSYGAIMWKYIVNEVKLPSETFDFYLRYDDHLLINICDSMAEILNDGTRDTYGFDKILRIAGRTFGHFLYAIDQLPTFMDEKSTTRKEKLSICYKRNQRLLYSTMPKHITRLLQSSVQAKSLCDCQPLVTIMFVYVIDLKTLTDHLDAAYAITCLNRPIVLLDTVANKFDVFKVEIKANASYMVVAGIHDQSYMLGEQNESQTSLLMPIIGEDYEDEEEEQIKNPFQFNSTEIIAALSLELIHDSKHVHNPITNKPFDLKFGFHSGMVIGGIVGTRNYQYCLFGDTVKIIGQIHLSQAAYSHLVAGKRFTIEHRGQVDIKGKGSIDTYWLTDSNEKFSTTTINKSTISLRSPFSGHGWTVK